MDLIDKCFKPLILIAALVWMVMAATHSLSNAQLLIYIGVLSICMGVRNLLILNISYRTNHYHPKLAAYVDRFGVRTGLIRYGVLLVGAYLVLGVLLIVVNL
ncbi:MAG: hypothetical protein Q4C56_06520 [Peptococcaceae bacterium]|nr:hypothetical protein [Peptococcaceae bacterium]